VNTPARLIQCDPSVDDLEPFLLLGTSFNLIFFSFANSLAAFVPCTGRKPKSTAEVNNWQPSQMLPTWSSFTLSVEFARACGYILSDAP
jgi:hypothetical protein